MTLSNKNPAFLTAIAVILVLFVSGCARQGGGVPEDIKVEREKGMASWYGPGFYGKRTASGERFNRSDLTAAHKKLPFGTMVKVVNMGNMKSTIVKINDRGPFAKRRIIDVSKKAAEELGMIGSGTAEVLIFYLPEEKDSGGEKKENKI